MLDLEALTEGYVRISVVIPAKNEEKNLKPLIEEIYRALTGVANFEVIYVDDGKYYTVSWPASNQGNYTKAPKLHSALCSNTVKIGAGKSSRKEEEGV